MDTLKICFMKYYIKLKVYCHFATSGFINFHKLIFILFYIFLEILKAFKIDGVALVTHSEHP